MSHDITLIRTKGRAAMIKSQIDAARIEWKSLRKHGRNQEAEQQWSSLIRNWTNELKELTGEVY